MSRKLVYGVGINDKSGWRNGSKYQQKVYNAWHGMLRRCYNFNDKDYYWYGGAGVTVCDRWLVFSNFASDVTKLVGWASWKSCGPQEYALEKDIVQSGVIRSNKVYSPQTCFFTTKENNSRERRSREGNPLDNPSSMLKYRKTRGRGCGVILPSGLVIEAISYREMASKLGCSIKTVMERCEGRSYTIQTYGKVMSNTISRGKLKGATFYLK